MFRFSRNELHEKFAHDAVPRRALIGGRIYVGAAARRFNPAILRELMKFLVHATRVRVTLASLGLSFPESSVTRGTISMDINDNYALHDWIAFGRTAIARSEVPSGIPFEESI